jgi:chromosome segregation ATPase
LATESEQHKQQLVENVQQAKASETHLQQLVHAAEVRSADVSERKTTAEEQNKMLQDQLAVAVASRVDASQGMRDLQNELTGALRLLSATADGNDRLEEKLVKADATIAALQQEASSLKTSASQQAVALTAAQDEARTVTAQEQSLRHDLSEVIDHSEFQLKRIQDLEGEAAVAKVAPCTHDI